MNTETEVELVEKYASTFRDLINSKIWPNKASIREALRLSKDGDWEFLCISMDIIEDACRDCSSKTEFF